MSKEDSFHNIADKSKTVDEPYNIDSKSEECIPEVPPSEYLDYSIAKRVRVIIKWGQNMPRTKQVILLKKIYPRLKSMSNSDLHQQIKEGIQWEFAIMWLGEALDLSGEAKKLGLTIELEEIKK